MFMLTLDNFVNKSEKINKKIEKIIQFIKICSKRSHITDLFPKNAVCI